LDCGWINQQIREVTVAAENMKQQATTETKTAATGNITNTKQAIN